MNLDPRAPLNFLTCVMRRSLALVGVMSANLLSLLTASDRGLRRYLLSQGITEMSHKY